jgi:hypothetical protein
MLITGTRQFLHIYLLISGSFNDAVDVATTDHSDREV